MIPYGKQSIDQDDIDAVVDVMNSDFLTQGPVTPKFEKAISEYAQSRHSVAVINATSALHIACLALGVKKGDSVWTSPISFVASANCAKYCGADVDFVDIDKETYNMSVVALEEKLKVAKTKNKLPKVIIPVHLSGQSCEMESIAELGKCYGFKIIEDASHAIGGSYKSKKIGSCQFSDICVFSFHPVKIITTCEGGVCTTNDKELYQKMYNLRSHGIVRNQEDMENIKHGPWYYEQIDLGFNYRLNDLQAALGISQLKRLDSFVEQRILIAKKYDKIFQAETDLKSPYQARQSVSSFHLYIIRIKKQGKLDRKVIFEKLRNNGILVNIHYIPIYRQPFYSKDYSIENFPNAESYYEEAISLPIFPGLTDDQIELVAETLKKPMNYQNIF
jgi:UDP-4-amino-4,6-dideoxy-N-acetyl-beta-L-altrosamine transaminase